MRAQLSVNPDGAFKILLVPENDADRYALKERLSKFMQHQRIGAAVNISRPLALTCGITLIVDPSEVVRTGNKGVPERFSHPLDPGNSDDSQSGR